MKRTTPELPEQTAPAPIWHRFVLHDGSIIIGAVQLNQLMAAIGPAESTGTFSLRPSRWVHYQGRGAESGEPSGMLNMTYVVTYRHLTRDERRQLGLD